ncbi:PTS system mannose/fructose/sorbose family transporter subunit IID [Desulfonatronovibrio hydrogenovorans]|uniref:PTS system mannose/fructose/sorbose family transporter subunit IID n=1 Tax=Desulfonatronovibrio hydrogenovorans TaxID=53245 RepID=UPI0004914268|nr:PTS system mannose/fructose/sorbose family transporter subunit IID [Desulfonatronovibrio hydrogenovorans]
MSRISLKALILCFLRSYLTGSACNTRGMQNIGLAYAMDPGLRELYPDPLKLQKARRRHLRFYNTHPFWNPLLVGLFLFLESKISRNLFPARTLPKVKSTLVFTLSAIGDSFFSGSLLVTWSMVTIILMFLGLNSWALGLGLALFAALQFFKLFVFHKGLTQGLVFINNLKKWDLINWGGRLKVINALLVPAFWLVIWPFNWHLYNFVTVSIACIVLAYAYKNLRWVRGILLLSVLALSLVMPDLFLWLEELGP